MPLFMRIIGYVVVTIATAIVLYMLWRIWRMRTYRNWYFLTLELLFWVYPIGFGLKAAILGPQWIRFYLGDFGFPIAVGQMLFLIFADKHTRDLLPRIQSQIRMMYVALVLSIAYEIFSGFVRAKFDATGSNVQEALIGSFDPLDILMYILGSMLALTVLYLWRRRVILIDSAIRQHEAALQQLSTEQARINRRQAERNTPGALRRKTKGRKRQR